MNHIPHINSKGEILAIEAPEKPNGKPCECSHICEEWKPESVYCQHDYNKALASAIENGVYIEDQQAAITLLEHRDTSFPFVRQSIERNHTYFDVPVPAGEEPAPKQEPQEEQDELWKEARHLIETWDIKGLHENFSIKRK